MRVEWLGSPILFYFTLATVLSLLLLDFAPDILSRCVLGYHAARWLEEIGSSFIMPAVLHPQDFMTSQQGICGISCSQDVLHAQ